MRCAVPAVLLLAACHHATPKHQPPPAAQVTADASLAGPFASFADAPVMHQGATPTVKELARSDGDVGVSLRALDHAGAGGPCVIVLETSAGLYLSKPIRCTQLIADDELLVDSPSVARMGDDVTVSFRRTERQYETPKGEIESTTNVSLTCHVAGTLSCPLPPSEG